MYYLEQNQDRSILYWIQNLISSQVTVVDGFPVRDLVIPSVSVEAVEIESFPYELGNTKELQVRQWMIDVFANTKSQRDQLAYLIFNELDRSIQVNDYNFTPETKLGCLRTIDKRLTFIRVFPEENEKLFYRAEIIFNTDYSKF